MTNIKVQAIDLLSDGRAVCICPDEKNSRKIFVEGLLPLEEADVLIEKQAKNFLSAKMVHLNKISENRVEPPCPHYLLCGGCQLQHLKYEEQLVFKSKKIESALRKNAKIQVTQPIPIVESKPLRYRNKIRLNVVPSEQGYLIGYHEKSSHDLIPINDCLLFMVNLEDLLKNLQNLMMLNSKGKDIYKEISFHYVQESKKMKLHFFMKHESLELQSLANALILEHPEISSISYSLKDSIKIKTLHGEEITKKTILSSSLFFSPISFLQTNDFITEIIYQKILDSLEKNDKVLEFYSGIGSLSLNIAKKVAHIQSVEIEKSSNSLAKLNQKINKLSNISFHEGDAAKYFPNEKSFSILILDPPRQGLHKNLIEKIKKSKIKRIIYLACDENTFARDIALLGDVYKLEHIEGFDMFPMTRHIEILAELKSL